MPYTEKMQRKITNMDQKRHFHKLKKKKATQLSFPYDPKSSKATAIRSVYSIYML